ncbi:MAG: hemerythrin domain-containing protein [Thermoanaerobaculales bacterium]|nr:hemerythrin domain-containing protein [Thermoanaerobaculales bacterium]
MTATTALRAEHEIILSVIACLRAACAAAVGEGRFDAETFRRGIDFIRGYADGWHHAKEEDLLFPALEKAGMPRHGGPVGVMLREHEIGRMHVRAMADAIDAAESGDAAGRSRVVENALGYADLLEAHIAKEDGILFAMADRILPEDEQRRLEVAYRSAVPAGATAATGDELEGLAAGLCERWGLDPDETRSRPMVGGCHQL